MKLQIPTSKLQRNSNNKAPTQAKHRHERFKYPNSSMLASLVNEAPSNKRASQHPFDLEERTAQFGEAIVRFSRKIPRDPTNDRLINQLVGCGTSIGANYCEANEGVSRKD